MPRERTNLRYQLYKSQARKQASIAKALLQLPAGLDLSKVRFEPIDAIALSAFELWENPLFCWREVAAWKSREPLSLDIAIWFEEQLCVSSIRTKAANVFESFDWKGDPGILIRSKIVSGPWR